MIELCQDRQVYLGDKRQVFKPADLREGMEIAVVDMLAEAHRWRRAAWALRQPTNLNVAPGAEEAPPAARGLSLQRAVSVWRQSSRIISQIPRWRGQIIHCSDKGVHVLINGRPQKGMSKAELSRLDPVDLPPYAHQGFRTMVRFYDMGLEPIQDEPLWRDTDRPPKRCIGRWALSATLTLRQLELVT